jgi:glycosyltransferase involved in cell wall biosynthesis
MPPGAITAPRVLVISEIPTPYRVPLFQAIAASGAVELTVLFCAAEEPDRPWVLSDDLTGFKHEVMRGLPLSVRTRRGTFVYEINPGIVRRLAHRDFDVLVVGGYSVFAEQVAVAFARLTGTPYIIHAESHHGKARRHVIQAVKARVLPQVVGHAAAGLATGSAAARYLASYGLEPSRIRIVPNTIDVARYAARADLARNDAARIRAELGLPDRYVLFAGRLVEAKGLTDLVQALDLLGDSAPPVVVAGTGPLEAELRIAPTVRLLGFQPSERLIDLYALAAVTVVPSRSEPWGVVVAEALACSCPVIATDAVGAAEDLIVDGRNGRVLPADSIEALAAALVEQFPTPDPDAGLLRTWTYEFSVTQFLEAVNLAIE